jgi:hypothetical protein
MISDHFSDILFIIEKRNTFFNHFSQFIFLKITLKLFIYRLYQNVSIFDGRDACSTNVWKVDDFETSGDSDSNDTNLIHIITYLKPYTQYALYVKTYTIASETKGAQSDILYFKTQPDSKYSSIFINSSLFCHCC